MRRQAKVVVDIETLAHPLDAFDSTQQEYLLRPAPVRSAEVGLTRLVPPPAGRPPATDRAEALLRLNLSPLTARVLAIDMFNPDSMRGRVLYEHPGGTRAITDDGRVELVPGNEREILEGFWKAVPHYPRIITFNGRAFDAPFLMLRSALLGIVPTRNLVPYRFSAVEHCDLLDQLTMYGASRRFSLDFYCKAFGIPSPKGNGITGLDMGSLVAEGKYRAIAEYCMDDARATAELYRRWEEFLSLT
jgi:DNA polymerase elongation subunit (family B)